MANNWRPPSAKSAGWAPRGRGLGAAMGGLREGATAFATQMMAIKQYEQEKEEKRLQREAEERENQLQWAWKVAEAKRQAEQDAITNAFRERAASNVETATKSLNDYRKWQMSRQEGADKTTDEANKHLANLMKLQTDVGQRYGKILRDAWMVGDMAKIKQVYDQSSRHGGLMATLKTRTTTKEGVPTEITQPSNDLNTLQGVAYNLLQLGKQTYGEPKKGYAYPMGVELSNRDQLKQQLIDLIGRTPDDQIEDAINNLKDTGVDVNLIDELVDEIGGF